MGVPSRTTALQLVVKVVESGGEIGEIITTNWLLKKGVPKKERSKTLTHAHQSQTRSIDTREA
jgi:hypothetical protein